jgi:DNA-directed RNA polymerase subunit beta'
MRDVVVREDDCGTTDSISLPDVQPLDDEGRKRKEVRPTGLLRRVPVEDVLDARSSEVLALHNTVIDCAVHDRILQSADGIQHVALRSPGTCQTRRGVCQLYYGWDLRNRRIVDLGLNPTQAKFGTCWPRATERTSSAAASRQRYQ